MQVLHLPECYTVPTTNPRIALTLPPHRYELLRRLADLQGVSMASIVGELLETVEPVFERMCVAIESVKSAPQEMHAGLLKSFLEAEAKVMPLLEEASAQSDLFLASAEHAAPIGESSTRAPRPQRSEDGRMRRAGSNPGNRNHPGQVSTECTPRQTTIRRKAATSKGKK